MEREFTSQLVEKKEPTFSSHTERFAQKREGCEESVREKTTEVMTTFRQLGEREIIRRLARLVPVRSEVRVGIGDDVAVVELPGTGYDLLLTSDAVIENVHFVKDAKAEQVGHKAIGRVLSDLAAMGGEPLWALLDLVATPETQMEWVEAVYRGASRLAERFGLAIVGGDTSSGPVREIHAFGVGRVPAGRAVLRSGAKPGQVVYVTGVLGGSLAGWHLTFEPRVAEGNWLRQEGWVTAMIDVSDGLIADLAQLAERSRVGAVIEISRVPVSEAARTMTDGRSALDHALADGEDFELLFTVPSDRREDFEVAWKTRFRLNCQAVGRITDEHGSILLQEANGRCQPVVGRAGYEHFV